MWCFVFTTESTVSNRVKHGNVELGNQNTRNTGDLSYVFEPSSFRVERHSGQGCMFLWRYALFVWTKEDPTLFSPLAVPFALLQCSPQTLSSVPQAGLCLPSPSVNAFQSFLPVPSYLHHEPFYAQTAQCRTSVVVQTICSAQWTLRQASLTACHALSALPLEARVVSVSVRRRRQHRPCAFVALKLVGLCRCCMQCHLAEKQRLDLCSVHKSCKR